MFDTHIHIMNRQPADPAGLLTALQATGFRGGVLISAPPSSFHQAAAGESDAQARLENLAAWCSGSASFFPFFWIDPTEPDAAEQVRLALKAGVAGFKIICTHFYPGDPVVLAVCSQIAAASKPVLFHSGILWNGRDSSRYNRPAEFEALLAVPRLRFALAHASWPWIDECLAVYGKFRQAGRSDGRQEVRMFIDLTPGTPPIYRRDLFWKLTAIGYDLDENLLYGSDNLADTYQSEWAGAWLARDQDLLRKLEPEVPGLDAADFWHKLTETNLGHFLKG